MPIYDQGYRRWEARGALHRFRAWPITREALRLVLARRALIALDTLAWLPALGCMIALFIGRLMPQARDVLPLDGRLFGYFLAFQVKFALLLSVFGGAGLVANDLRTGAILVYLSRPLSRVDYVVGKLGVLLALNLSVTLLPGLGLYAAALGMSPDAFQKWELAWIAPAIVLQSLIISLPLGLLALAVSAISRSARTAGLGLVGALIFLQAAAGLLRRTTRSPLSTLLSVTSDIQALGSALFGLTDFKGLAWGWPALVLALLGVACALVLRRRVQAVEVIS